MGACLVYANSSVDLAAIYILSTVPFPTVFLTCVSCTFKKSHASHVHYWANANQTNLVSREKCVYQEKVWDGNGDIQGVL